MQASNHLFHHIVNKTSSALSEVADLLSGDQARARQLFALGSIYLNKNRIFADEPVNFGDYIRIHSVPRRYTKPRDLESHVLWDDPWYTIFDKPSGVPCHPTVDNARENLIAWWEEHLEARTWVTHRLDVGTSGCLVVAKSSEAAGRFNQLLLRDEVQKDYEALAEGDVQHRGPIVNWMVDDNWAPRVVKDHFFEKALECRMQILSSETLRNVYDHEIVSRVQLRLETGRTHQIRTQMGFLGHPILNDEMYGARLIAKKDNLALCARHLQFKHPWTGESVTLTAKRNPEDHLS